MALQAQQIHVAHPEHVNVSAPMWNVAGRASLDLDGLVLEYKRSLLVSVAREANGILCSRGPHLLWPDRTVHIVAVRALD